MRGPLRASPWTLPAPWPSQHFLPPCRGVGSKRVHPHTQPKCWRAEAWSCGQHARGPPQLRLQRCPTTPGVLGSQDSRKFPPCTPLGSSPRRGAQGQGAGSSACPLAPSPSTPVTSPLGQERGFPASSLACPQRTLPPFPLHLRAASLSPAPVSHAPVSTPVSSLLPVLRDSCLQCLLVQRWPAPAAACGLLPAHVPVCSGIWPTTAGRGWLWPPTPHVQLQVGVTCPELQSPLGSLFWGLLTRVHPARGLLSPPSCSPAPEKGGSA